MKPANEIRVEPLFCPKCGETKVWVEIDEQEKIPSRCFMCDEPVKALTGSHAAELCFRECAEWAKLAESTMDGAKRQIRYSQACKYKALALSKAD